MIYDYILVSHFTGHWAMSCGTGLHTSQPLPAGFWWRFQAFVQGDRFSQWNFQILKTFWWPINSHKKPETPPIFGRFYPPIPVYSHTIFIYTCWSTLIISGYPQLPMTWQWTTTHLCQRFYIILPCVPIQFANWDRPCDYVDLIQHSYGRWSSFETVIELYQWTNFRSYV